MSIVPSDSASRQGVSTSDLGRPEACNCPHVYPSPDLIPLIGPARYADQLDAYNKQVDAYYRQMGSYYAAYQSFCRVSTPNASEFGSTVSPVSSFVSSRAGSSTSASVRSVAKGFIPGKMSKTAVRNLSKRVKALGVTSSLPGGYCYARAVRPEARESVALSLGSYPTMADLLSRPREEFLPESATAALVLTLGSTGLAHVDYSGVSSCSFNSCVVQLAHNSEFPFGSYGHMLRTGARVYSHDPSLEVFQLSTPVGSDGYLSGTPTADAVGRVGGFLDFSVGSSSYGTVVRRDAVRAALSTGDPSGVVRIRAAPSVSSRVGGLPPGALVVAADLSDVAGLNRQYHGSVRVVEARELRVMAVGSVAYVRLHTAFGGATDVGAVLSALAVTYGDCEIVPASGHDMCVDSFKREVSVAPRLPSSAFPALDVRVGDYLALTSRLRLGGGSSVP